MKEVPLRRFTTVVSYLTEPVMVTKDGEAIGAFTPIDKVANIHKQAHEMENTMDDTARKAIEPDKTKVERGQIRKGLGDLPGEAKDAPKTPEFRPAPKPGKTR
jgi:hypothetical protein